MQESGSIQNTTNKLNIPAKYIAFFKVKGYNGYKLNNSTGNRQMFTMTHTVSDFHNKQAFIMAMSIKGVVDALKQTRAKYGFIEFVNKANYFGVWKKEDYAKMAQDIVLNDKEYTFDMGYMGVG